MSKKTFMAAIIILAFLVSLVAGMQGVEVAKANPFFIYNQIDPVPGTIPPNITISNPQNNTAYSSDKITVSFYVGRPQLGTCNAAIIDIKYVLDNETVQVFTIWRGNSASNSYAIPEYNTTFTLFSLPEGNHDLTVTAEGVVYAGNMDIFFIDGSATASFAIGNQSMQLSPTPAQIATLTPKLTASPSLSPTPFPSPSPTITPTPSPSPSATQNINTVPSNSPAQQSSSEPTDSEKPTSDPSTNDSLNPLPEILGVVSFAILATAGAVVVYFKKSKVHSSNE